MPIHPATPGSKTGVYARSKHGRDGTSQGWGNRRSDLTRQGYGAASKRFRDTGFLKRNISPLATFNLIIDHEFLIVNWAVPNLMIALALTNKGATMLAQDGLDP
jgi:hypothetical protein